MDRKTLRAIILFISYLLVMFSAYHFGGGWGVALAFGATETLDNIVNK